MMATTTPTWQDPPPEDPVTQELKAMVAEDQSRLGDVYNGRLEGLDARQMAAKHGVASTSWVSNYGQIIDAIIDGKLPTTSPSMALQCARRFRSILKGKELSPGARTRMQDRLVELERLAEDRQALDDETAAARRETEQAEEDAPTGVYVYALPHYLRYRFDPATGRTLLKVGRSDRDIIRRFRDQIRTTALPEQPVLLRMYLTDDETTAATVEAQFHRILSAADHFQNEDHTAGREWFVTSTRFLDEFAHALGLDVREVSSMVLDEE